MAVRNPPWSNDELLLALDLYLREGPLGGNHPAVRELSDILNALPIHTTRPDHERFRNPNAVAMKLANFVAVDPTYAGGGLAAGGDATRRIFASFVSRPTDVATIAARLRAGARGKSGFPIGTEEGEDSAEEGRLLFRTHRVLERDRRLRVAKRRLVLETTGRLACEVCDFDFQAIYGREYFECHHVIPLARTGMRVNRPADLAVVCANCHRILHLSPWPSLNELRALITRGRRSSDRKAR